MSAVVRVKFKDKRQLESCYAKELAQNGISSRGYTPGPYSNREDLLYAFDRFILRELAERRG